MMTVEEFQKSSAKVQTIFLHLAIDIWHEMHNAYENRLAASGSCKNDALSISWNGILFEQAGESPP